ncbi:major facilitator superfamily domain-containing protein [Mycena maculata]|uniref:Major facilitator superfamily domain-containing protein n=1 Tax=Mycena maculata TaxID=230809 RepID=A0AAD7K8Y3_9AGAR|nr:major facilitator superfamily domain-containing protein [Mycena maculata]
MSQFTLSETEPLICREIHSDVSSSGSRYIPALRLFPVVILASICRGISMYARFDYYQDTFCPDANYTCGWFQNWLMLTPNISVRMEMWPTFALFVVSFTTVGWWSTFGDRRGRRPVLFVSLFGALLFDLIYLVVANIPAIHKDAQDSLSLGIIIYGLLGGFATYTGVILAYASDISPSPLSRTAIFGVLEACSFTGFRIGAVFGRLAGSVLSHSNLSYILSVFIAAVNLAYIYFVLPESLEQTPREQYPLPPGTAAKYIFSPFSVIFRSRKHLVLLALATYMYSLTLALDASMLSFNLKRGYFPSLSRSLLLAIPAVLNLLVLLFIIPALALLFKNIYGDTEKSGLMFAKSIAQNSILVAVIAVLSILEFGGPGSTFLFGTFSFLYPFSAGALPALYSLAASYLIALHRSSEIGALFGALYIWVSLADYISHAVLDSNGFEIFGIAAVCLVIAIILLVPDGPSPPSEDTSGVDGADIAA